MRISKSRYIAGLQCHKHLWNLVNDPTHISAPDAFTRQMFEQGHRVGSIAKERYPNGYEVPYGALTTTITRTRDVLSGRIPLFEASFARDDAYCRIDILVPRDDTWDIIEVKSSTRVKDTHLEDVAFQKWVASRTIPIGRCMLMHIDTSYVRNGAIDPQRILAVEDITDAVTAIEPLVEERVKEMIAIIDGPQPDVPIGTQCTNPHSCPLIEHCWKDVPNASILTAYRMPREEAFEHYHGGRGYANLDLSGKHAIQQEAHLTNERHVDRKTLGRWLDRLEEPIICLDFETASSAVPFADGMRPYEQIPFQYSAHVSTDHYEFLSEESDPRRSIAESLLTLPKGTLLAHNASFEKRIIKALADRFDDLRDDLLALNERMLDLMTPFANFAVYDPKQNGSCSMKAILPAFGIADYKTLTISSGDQAAANWLRLVTEKISTAEKESIRRSLLEYCRLDTYGMVRILEELRRHR